MMNNMMLAQLMKDLQDPEIMAEAQKMMNDPKFQEQMKKVTESQNFKTHMKTQQDALKDPKKLEEMTKKMQEKINVGNAQLEQAKAVRAKAEAEAKKKGDDDDDDKKKQFQDPQFVNQLLGSLPGVNPDDPAIQSALKQLNKNKTEEGDDKGKKDDDKK
mmetsp:Transcript_15491/g.35480  ORF Transcript_15491/g.35480 Transcript_15491/m.35480 type:complete len:159 (-) Transcript_15491:1745-2221(-)